MVKPVELENDVWSSEFDDLSSSTTASYSSLSRVQEDAPVLRAKSVTIAPPKPLLIFDWDDTILPTSWLNSMGHRLEGPNPAGDIKTALDRLSLVINETLRVAARKGHVMIITNAEDRWVSLTVDKFLPDSAKIVNKFQHISARSMFEPTGVTHPIEWKENAFRLVVDEYISSGRSSASRRHHRQVVSIGDSVHEREAVLKVCSEMKRRYPMTAIRCKSLKFMERPDIDSIVKQHQLIQECLNDVLDHKEDLDLCIQPADSTESKYSSKVK